MFAEHHWHGSGMAPMGFSHLMEPPFPMHSAQQHFSCSTSSGFGPFGGPPPPPHHSGHHHSERFSPPLPPLTGSPPRSSPCPPNGPSSSGHSPFPGSPAHSFSPASGDSPPPSGMRSSHGFGGPYSGPPPLISIGHDVSSCGNSRFSSPERAGGAHGAGAALASLARSSSNTSTSSSGGSGSPPATSSLSSSASSGASSSSGGSPMQTSPIASSKCLIDLHDPSYYSTPVHAPERQVVVLTSRIKEKVQPLVKTQWLDQQLSFRQCPYPIQHIEFTHAGDAVVQFISEDAMVRALARPPLIWAGPHMAQEIATRPCTEDDINALFWVGVLGASSDWIPAIRQAVQPYGEVRGEYAPHPSMVDPTATLLQSELNGHAPEFIPGVGLRHGSPTPGSSAKGPNGGENTPSSASCGMLKLYFAPGGRRRLPPTIQISLSDGPKAGAQPVVRLFTPYGPLAPKCGDFGSTHTPHGCPECARRF